MILAGDIGGTKTRLAIGSLAGGEFHAADERVFASREHGGLEQIVRTFLDETGRECDRACFGIAGPVVHGRCEATNLPWIVDVRSLARVLGTDQVWLLNDLEANAWGLEMVRPERIAVLNEGEPIEAGNIALISAGTGLGEAGLVWSPRGYRPFASEGGHSSFSPTTALETELWQFLAARFGHVSWERVLSGSGLVHLYEFLRIKAGVDEPDWFRARSGVEDRAALVSESGLRGDYPVAAEALNLFVRLYGVQAGNLALTLMATAGVFLGGGIAPKILERLQGPLFLGGFLAKGRLRPLLSSMPVRVVLDDRAALLGAVRRASLGTELGG